MLPILWLMPRMTVNLITFNFIITVYLITGSIHEEKRLSEAYGAAYYEYQKSGINFFFPSLPNLVKFIKS
jgi:protein-S-isoprenylcysteine O-methyltransferase Ste14